jgi:hypothetical protein
MNVSISMNQKLFVTISLLIVSLLLLSSGLAVSNPQKVNAASTLTTIKVSPESGKVGSEVVISGTNFPGTLATIYWDKRVTAQKIPIAADGKFSYTMTVPESIKGIHTIGVIDNSNWEGSAAESNYSVKPGIKLFPDVIDASSSLTIYGNGFGDRESGIKVLLDNKTAAADNLKSDWNGNWSTVVSFNSITKGRHALSVVSGSSSELGSADLGFIISPWCEVSPLTGPVGTQIFIYAWGLRQNEDGLTITLDNEIFFTNIRAEVDGTLKLDGSKRVLGSFVSDFDYRDKIFVPNATQGDHIIGVYGSSFTPKGTFPNFTFKITPSLTLDPKSGKEAAIVSITGTGFAADEVVSLKYDGKEVATGIKADATGTFVTQYTVPGGTTKDHTLAASGNKSNSANATFILEKQVAAAVPALTSPSNGIQVSSFKSVGDVYLGSFEYIGGIFSYLSGSQPAKKSLTVTTLKWSMPANTGQWTYELQVSRNKNFSAPVVNQTLSTTEYNYVPGDASTNGIYYWRVRGLDVVGTASEWSSVNQFEIIPMSTQVGLISLLILVLLIAAIVVIVLVIRSVRARRQ